MTVIPRSVLSAVAIAPLATFFSLWWPQVAFAQSITPSGSGTQVETSGGGYTITGGSRSADGGNLFHSFEQFGLSAGEWANFIADPAVQNILGRITGGDASLIDGTLQVTGANANLYLINPAGILFGPNARLDLPAAFTATTADGVGFGGNWFSAAGTNDYSALRGNPTAFAFTAPNPGSVVNAGELAVLPDQSLTLLGGNVVNTGSLSAPGGGITLAAVPGESLVQISHEDLVLNLQVEAIDGAFPDAIAPLDLPQLLTLAPEHATGLTVADDGTVQLSGSGMAVPHEGGSAVVLSGEVTAEQGRLNLSGGSLSIASEIGQAGGAAETHATLNLGTADRAGRLEIAETGLLRMAEMTLTSPYQAAAGEAGIVIANDRADGLHGTALTLGPRLSFEGYGFNPSQTVTAGELIQDAIDVVVNGGVVNLLTGTFDQDGLIQINNRNLTLQGQGADQTIISGNNNNGVFQVSNSTVNFNDLTVQDGNSNQSGSAGGITVVLSDVVINNSRISNNIATDTESLATAGGISIFMSTVSVNNSLIDGNSAPNAGGLNLDSGSAVTMTNSTISGNTATVSNGGGINNSGTLILNNSTITNNTAAEVGGGLFVFGTAGVGTIDAVNSIVAGNFASSSPEAALVGGNIISGGNNLIGTNGDPGGFPTIAEDIVLAGDISTAIGPLADNGGPTPTHALIAGSPAINAGRNDGIPGGVTTDQRGATRVVDGVVDIGAYEFGAEVPEELPEELPEEVPEELPEEVLEEVSEDSDPDNPISFVDPGGDLSSDVFQTAALDDEETSEELGLDQVFSQEFADYLGLEEAETSFEEGLDRWTRSAQDLGVSPAVVYVSFVDSSDVEMPLAVGQRLAQANADLDLGRLDRWQGARMAALEQQLAATRSRESQAELELVLLLPDEAPIRYRLSGVTRGDVLPVADQLRREILDPTRRRGRFYETPAQQIHDWIVAPLQRDLDEHGVDNLAFVMDAGLRSMPIAALHDGEQFLIETYSIGLMPSLSLTDTRHVDLRQAEVLAMGAAEFELLPDLPAVPLELSVITEKLWPGRKELNQTFTQRILAQSRSQVPYGILHLATHGEFMPGPLSNSFLQFWDQQLPLDQLRQLQLNNPPIDLLVLSACRMALGNEEAELGFAGVAVKAGVRTAIASLWTVDDTSTAGLMSEFYTALRETPVRAEALRQAQLAMMRGEAKVVDGMLRWSGGEVPLPPELVNLSPGDLSHPFFWSGFTLVGSPW